MSTYLFDHLVLSSIFFSIFYFTRDFLSYFFIHFFGDMIWMHVTCPFQWVDYITGVRHDWLPWISWLVHVHEPFSTPAMNFTHRNWWIICIQTVSSKNNKKISKSPEIASNEVEITLEKYAFIEPDGEHYCRKTVFWCKYGHTKIPMIFTIINILSIGKNIVSELNIALHVKHCLTARLVRIFKIRIGSSILFFTGSHLIPCSWVYH